MKKSLIVLSVVAVLFTGCMGEVSEKQKFLNTVAEVSCEVFKPMDDMKKEGKLDMEQRKTFMAEAEEIVKKNGFESMEAFQEAGKKYEEEEIKKDAKKAVMDKCGYDIDKF